jgi:hypothetical protein
MVNTCAAGVKTRSMLAASQPAQNEPPQPADKTTAAPSEPAPSEVRGTTSIISPGDIKIGRNGKHLSTKVPEAEVSKLTLADEEEEGTDIPEEEDVEEQPR